MGRKAANLLRIRAKSCENTYDIMRVLHCAYPTAQAYLTLLRKDRAASTPGEVVE